LGYHYEKQNPINLKKSALTPEIQQTITFIATATASGIIGNRADSWFVNLYYHEKSRILAWIREWSLTEDDKRTINKNEKLKILFSQITSNVANEIFDEKLAIWSSITESLLRNKKYKFEKKQYFINLFIKLDTFTINYLVNLIVKGPIISTEVFPYNEFNKPNIKDPNFGFYLGQIQSASTGLTDMYSDKNNTYFKISELGKEFIDFISNSSENKIKSMIKNINRP